MSFRLKDGRNIPAPQCIMLSKCDYQLISSVYYDKIFQSLTSFGNDGILTDKINYALLNILLAYDNTGKQGLLDLSILLSEWLFKECDTLPIELRQLNRLQSLKRQRRLSDEEQIVLYNIAKSCTNANIQTAAYLLLDENDKAKESYKRIKNKREFKNFPIYSFMKSKK